MTLYFDRKPNETWLGAALRISRQYDLEEEVSIMFDAYRKDGDSPEEAAWGALYEWDLLTHEQKPQPDDEQ